MPSKYMQVPQPSNENDSNDAVEKKPPELFIKEAIDGLL